jgi:photosystem II stability/assembly factor-like uncharacterized protein
MYSYNVALEFPHWFDLPVQLPEENMWRVQVQALSAEHVFALSPDGVVFHTSDGGRNWLPINIGIEIETFWFVSLRLGFALASHGLIFKTTDGGLSWTRISEGIAIRNPTDMFFANDHCGWIAGDKGMIALTTDGGGSWKPGRTPVGGWVTRIRFSNLHCGWACVKPSFFDENEIAIEAYGLWLAAGKPTGTEAQNWLQAQKLLAERNAGGLLRSIDGGESWDLVDAVTEPIDVALKGPDIFVLDRQRIVMSQNNGGQWAPHPIPELIGTSPELYAFWCLFFSSPLRGWIGGYDSSGILYTTATGGEEWAQGVGVRCNRILSIDAVTESIVWAAGGNYSGTATVIGSTDGGMTWPYAYVLPHAGDGSI